MVVGRHLELPGESVDAYDVALVFHVGTNCHLGKSGSG